MLTIANLSDCSTVIGVRVVSKVISCAEPEFAMAPFETRQLKVEYVPRKINSNYRKTITIVNGRNRLDSPEVQVHACNVDTQDVLYHSAFYRLRVLNNLKQVQVTAAAILFRS